MVISSRPTFKEALNWASLFLHQAAIEDITGQILMMRLFDWDLTELVNKLNNQMTEQEATFFRESVERYVNDEPLAYILGYQDFMGLRFKVNESTLIPREETRGILDLLTSILPEDFSGRVLDIGTGSGIIAILVKEMFPQAEVFASDISSDALAVANHNASKHDTQITFIQSDMFQSLDENLKFDIILSNPPYISIDEIPLMDQSVLKYEPKQALFANDQGLAYYQIIANQMLNFLNQPGMVIVEIGFNQAEPVGHIFKSTTPSATVQLHRDINGLDRFIQVNI